MKYFSIVCLIASSTLFSAQRSHCQKCCDGAGVLYGLNHPYIEGEFLYWYARQQGNDFATTGIAITVPETTDPNTSAEPPLISSAGSLYEPSAKMNPGFRFRAGNQLCHDDWGVFLEYTLLTSVTKNEVSSVDLNTGIIPIFNYGPNNSILSTTLYAVETAATGFVASARGDWKLAFNNLLFELEKTVKGPRYFYFSPHFGLNAAWMYQKLDLLYKVNSITATSTLLGSNKAIFMQDFWGIGPTFGIDTDWVFNHCISLFADAGLSLLYGSFDVKAKSYDTNDALSYSNRLIADQKYGVHTINPTIKCSLGANAAWTVYREYLLELKAAWDAQIWFFQNQHSSTIADTSLVLQGLTVGAKITY